MITPFKNRTIDPMKPVRVYRNLHLGTKDQRVFSVMQNGLIVAHATDITLSHCRFIVSEAGRKRVLATKRKAVHAFVDGFMWAGSVMTETLVTYNPYQHATFVKSIDHTPVHSAKFVNIGQTGVHAFDLK